MARPVIGVLAGTPSQIGESSSVDSMNNRNETGEFLATRRAKITPDQAGLPSSGNRRVPGLRRGEVAALAGVSVEYYTRLERGNLAGVSESVLEALSRALRLDEAERTHLHDLARAAGTSTRRSRTKAAQRIKPGVQIILDSMTNAPAFVRNGRMDVLATNALARALYSELFTDPGIPANLARFVFLNPHARDFYLDWNRAADDNVAILRTESGRDPFDRGLTDLVGELSTRSIEFRVRWAAHNVRQHYTGSKDFHHPAIGDLHLIYEAMDLPASPGLSMLVYNAEPGTASIDALHLLASWAATNAIA